MGVLVPGSSTWFDTLPAALAAMLLLFVPGAVALFLLGLRPLAALAVAPVVSTGLVAATGVLLPFVHIRWGVGPLLVATAVLWLVCAGLRALLQPDPTSDRTRGAGVDVSRYALGAVLLAFVVVLVSVLPEQGSPESFPQNPDTVFHLADVQWMLRNGTISSLQAGQFQIPSWSGFYPAAFHGLTATVSLLTGASAAVASTAFVLVVVGVVWPLGCVVLALTVLGNRPGVALATGLTSVAFGAYPYLLMGYGVLWPLVLGMALVPASLAVVVGLVDGPTGHPYVVAGRGRCALLLVVAVGALTLAHPNALLTFGLLAGLALGQWVVTTAWGLRTTRRGLAVGLVVGSLVAAALAVGAVVVLRSPSMFDIGRLGPGLSADRVWSYVLLFAADGVAVLPVLAALVGLGCVAVALRHRNAAWCVVALGVSLTFLWFNIAVDDRSVRALTWPWYNDTPRIQAIAVLPAVLIASAALLWIADLVIAVLRRSLPAHGLREHEGWASGAAVLVLGLVTLVHVSAHQQVLRPYFHPTAARSWVSDGELRALRELSTSLPDDAVVAANPWTGATYLYVVSGRRLLVPTEKTNYPGDVALLSLRLRDVGTDSAVCAAAARHHVEWAITGGQPAHPVTAKVLSAYRGVDGIRSSSAWRPVRTEGPYTLYRRSSCAGLSAAAGGP